MRDASGAFFEQTEFQEVRHEIRSWRARGRHLLAGVAASRPAEARCFYNGYGVTCWHHPHYWGGWHRHWYRHGWWY